jgi:trigger factor
VKVTIERPTEAEAVLNVQLDWAELEKASDRAYHKLAEKTNVPGFRRGHVPRTMLERMVGKEAIYQEGLEDLIFSTYRDAIRQSDLTPLAQPELDTPPIAMGQSYTYTARVPVLPPVKLGDYNAIRVEQPSTDVSDEDIEHTIEHIRQDQAAWLPVERPAQLGDKVTVDLKLTVGDRTVSDLHDNEFELTAERAGIFTGMDAQVVGMSEGESKDFTTTIPEDYANADLAGKEAQYAVAVKGVKVRELPAIDDELAKTAGNYESLAALRDAIRAQLKTQKETEARRTIREDTLKAVADASQAEIPPVLVTDETDVMIRELRSTLERNRLTLEQYLEMLGKTEEQYREEIRPEATERVKRDLVLDAVADAEHIAVSDRDIENWLQLLAMVGGQRRRLRDLSAAQRANVVASLRRDRAATRLIEIATQDHTKPDAQAGAADSAATETPAAQSENAAEMATTPTSSSVPAAETAAAPGGEASGATAAASPAKTATAAATAETAAKTATPAVETPTGTRQKAAKTATASKSAGPAAQPIPPNASDE